MVRVMDRLGVAARRHTALVLPAVAAALAVLAACGGGARAADPVTPTTPAVVATTAPAMTTGEQVYATSCAGCHGMNLEGKRDAPALDQARILTLGEQRLEQSIRYGKGRMKGFPNLTDAQVQALMDFLEDQ